MTKRSRSNITATSAPAQRARLLERLLLGPVSTFDARYEMNIMALAPRIKELRERGHLILTAPLGFKHAGVAVYYLPGCAHFLAA